MPTIADGHTDAEHDPGAGDEPEFEPADEIIDDSDLADAEDDSALSQYLSVVGGYPRLDHAQEIRLTAQMQAQPRLARLRADRARNGQPPAPAELLAELFDNLALAWRRLQADAGAYRQWPPDLDRLLGEAQAVRADGEADKLSYLCGWLNRGPWGTEGWEPAAHLAYEIFVALYLFPPPVQTSLRAHLDRHPGGTDTALLPAPAVFRSWLPAAAEIQADFEALSLRADQASQFLVQANLLRVVGVARRYVGRGVSLLDLIQAGNIGLLRAVERYDPAKGGTFRTYAAGWMRQTITRAIGA